MRKVWVLVTGALLACGGQVVSGMDGGIIKLPPVTQQSIDKVDLLFAIGNSSSMGDKRDLLAAAVPVLVNRLINPNCVSTDSSLTCKAAGDCSSLGAGAQCDAAGRNGAGQCFVPGDNKGEQQCSTIPNTRAEFLPVYDIHIGVVSSSLGGGGATDICVPANPDATHQDDKGRLINRTLVNDADGPPINNAKPADGNGGNFLAWLPASDPKNAGKPAPNVTPYGDGQSTQLVTDFQSLVEGVQQHGCGLQAQLDSWYRFLVSPDPYDSIAVSSDSVPRATLQGVDATLLKMRHDFLRPDSLVAIIQVTDREDSWSDPLWLGDSTKGGFGWTVRTQTFPGGPGQGVGPRGTSECDQPIDPNNPTTTGPNNPDCVSCAFPQSTKPVAGTPIGSDPNCQSCAPGVSTCPKKGWYSPASPSTPITAADGLNVRYGNQYTRRRYGLDAQYPIQRYVDGLTSPEVPDRDHESHDASKWAPTKNCTNPLFAAGLPDGSDTSQAALCNLKLGSRTPDLVFYTLIGGVPQSLVADASGNFKGDLTASDWQKILGKDPDHFDLTGIDPHMIESLVPRAGLPTPGASYALGNDPDNGREWNTLTSNASVDLQYACTFLLPAARDCTAPANAGACDCLDTNGATTAADGPPLCDTNNRMSQIKGKAYPTIRELRVAKALGGQAVVASVCAKVVSGSTSDPTYGYNPAMQAIVNRLKNALGGQCLPKNLIPVVNGTASCLMLVEYPNQTDQAAGCTDPGMSQPDPSVVSRFDQQFQASLGDAGTSPAPPVVCQFKQLVPGTDYQGATCEGSPAVGWCYVTGAGNTGGCAQAIKFGGSGPPAGTIVDLECPQ